MHDCYTAPIIDIHTHLIQQSMPPVHAGNCLCAPRTHHRHEERLSPLYTILSRTHLIAERLLLLLRLFYPWLLLLLRRRLGRHGCSPRLDGHYLSPSLPSPSTTSSSPSSPSTSSSSSSSPIMLLVLQLDRDGLRPKALRGVDAGQHLNATIPRRAIVLFVVLLLLLPLLLAAAVFLVLLVVLLVLLLQQLLLLLLRSSTTAWARGGALDKGAREWIMPQGCRWWWWWRW